MFKLMQLTDIHYTDGGARISARVALMRELIAAEEPDMIIVTGDTVCGPDVYRHLRCACAGDRSGRAVWLGYSATTMWRNPARGRGCLSVCASCRGAWRGIEADSVDGVGNCCVRLVNADGATEWLLFCLDSATT